MRLWNQAGNRTSDLSLGALIGGIENGVLRGISSTAWWLLYTGQPRPISQRYEEKLPGPADIVLELQSAMDALNGRLHRPVPRDYAAGVLRTLQWVRGTPDVPRPVPKLDHELADGDWVGVRTARDVRAVADRHREAVSEVDAFDEWGSGVEHTLRWALGTFVSAPMAVAAIGEDPPDRARLQTEARSAAGPPDARPGGEPVPYVRGVQAGLAWLLDPAARTPLPSS
ncbi:MAG: hypothetical protein HOV94_02135 [Saccharothrix sp.]|nr:hypothetical protein [Saccharothrix sp.]